MPALRAGAQWVACSPVVRICNRLQDLNSLQLWAMRSRLAGAGVWGMQYEAKRVQAGGSRATGLPHKETPCEGHGQCLSLNVSAHQRLMLNPAHFVTVSRPSLPSRP